MKEYLINSTNQGQRVDKFVRKVLPQAPLSFIYRLFRVGDIKINGKKVKINAILAGGDKLQIYIHDQKFIEFNKQVISQGGKSDIDVIFEDENILVINKEVGVEVQPNPKETTLSLSQLVSNYFFKNGGREEDVFVPSPAHRLDRNTSGVILFGKNILTLQTLFKIFKESELEKEYLAIVIGYPKKQEYIKSYLYKNADTNTVKVVDKNHPFAKEAILKYSLLEQFDGFALISVTLFTGRTHQIRVQMASIGLPILGDQKYGNFNINKQFNKIVKINNQLLHSHSIVIKNGFLQLDYLVNKQFIAPKPKLFLKVLDYFERQNQNK